MNATHADPRRLIGVVVADRYRIDALVGEGGMGTVYRGAHVTTKKPIALKVLNLDLLDVDEAVERFQREAVAGAHMQHPNVAAAIDFGTLADGSHFYVLEYLEGTDLRSVIAEGPMPVARALHVARQIALGLRAAHVLGIVHRDLKPENVMLATRDGERDVVKLLDFGIAKVPLEMLAGRAGPASARALTQLGMVYGTPEYMAPEQALGQDVDGRADLYALGGVLFEMLTGARVFHADSRPELVTLVTGAAPPSVSARLGRPVPSEVEALVARLLSKRAEDRFADAALAAEAIARVAARLDSSIPKETMHKPTMPRGTPRIVEPGATISVPRASMVSGAQLPAANGRGATTPIVLAGFGLAALVAMVVAAVMLRDPQTVSAMEALATSSSAAAGAPLASGAPDEGASAGAAASGAVAVRTVASQTELEAAKQAGLASLGPLAQKYPSDPNVLRALLLAHAGDRTSYAAAMRVAKRLFEVAPTAANDDEVRQVILMAANGVPEAAIEAFDVMQHMGPGGPDLLYELVVAPNVGKYPKDRATTLLSDPEVMKSATPALRIANELRLENGCQRKPLLARAREEGDARALHYLKPLQSESGCGLFRSSDCYGCFGNRKELNEVIEAIEQRIARKAQP